MTASITITSTDRYPASRLLQPPPRGRAFRASLACGLLLIGAVLGLQPAQAQDPDLPGAVPNMKLIESGALVIPMDTTNQNLVAGFPFNIKAYGLVNKLLQNEIPVLWAISATKAKDGVDFTVAAQRVLPTAVASATKSFSAGPFIVTKDHAAAAQALATAFAGSVAVYKTDANVTVDVRYDLRFKPYVGVGNVNTAIHSKILVAAGFPGSITCGAHSKDTCNWTMVDPLAVNSFSCLTSHTDPHRDTSLSTAAPIRAAIATYLQAGGNFIAQCAAVRYFEGEAIRELDAGHYLTTKGITDADNNTAHTFPQPNVPFLQMIGDVDPGQGGSWPDGVLPTGGAWKNNGYIVVKDTTPVNSFQAAAGKMRTGIGGNVFYLGGHEYGATSKNLPEINGNRMFLNSLFVPPTRPPSCGFAFLTPGEVTIVKDTDPDNPWFDFNFTLSGPSIQNATLQDPGTNECPAHPLCADPENSPAWDHVDRTHFINLEPTKTAAQRYTFSETGLEDGESEEELTLDDYDITWACKNAPVPSANPVCDPSNAQFDFDACPALASSCAQDSGWSDGYATGTGVTTAPFDLCEGGHVICRYTNMGGPTTDVCLESANAIGDLQVLGAQGAEQVSFTTAAVSSPGGDSFDSIFLASFMPIADQSRWPGEIDHFLQPLPLIDVDGALVPDKSKVCDNENTEGCLAWSAAVEILDQAPDALEVATNRRIGMTDDDRRVTYAQAAAGAAVPRTLRAFNYNDADTVTTADEKDLWEGMGIAFIEGDEDSEQIARDEARNVIRETLKQRTITLTDPDTEDEEDLAFVLGDFFHASPTLVIGPQNFFYLANDLEGNGKACHDTSEPTNHGYRCFFEQERRRRHVLLAPSNDGQLHGFDAGFYLGSVQAGHLVNDDFDHGTGREVFAHIPRPMLAHTREMLTQDHDFGIDGGLVVDDAFIDPVHNGTPVVTDRRWRTVAIGSYRQGGRGLFALDLTHPDPVEGHTIVGDTEKEYIPEASERSVPECSAVQGSLPAGCDHPYPSELWEFLDECTFVDTSTDTGTESIVPCDEDDPPNGYPDLAFSWSKVNTGRILVVPEGQTVSVVKFVAIFGGGLDPENPGVSGNFLYMVDIETGKTLYKSQVTGAVPSEPAAVDTDQNGILDTLYVGTTAGFLYKVDISDVGVLDSSNGQVDEAVQWSPFRIFDTGGRAIFFPPTVIFDSNSGHYAVGFGTGDREDLWSVSDPALDGRFYMILDTGFVEGLAPIASGPLTEDDFEQIPVASDPTNGNFLIAPVGDNRPGWVLQLGPDERVVSDALAISGLLAFTTFNPEHPEVCVFGGSGKIYTVLATNADPIGGEDFLRFQSVEGFAGEPVVTSEGFTTPGGSGDPPVDPFEANQQVQAVRNSLMGLFPSDCRFGNFSLNVSTSLSSREVMPLAQIPVCIARKNWTEH